MDATGLSAFSALPLLPLMGLYWYLERMSRREMGFVWGQARHYGLAIVLPLLVLATIALISAAARVVDVSQTNWNKTWLNVALVTSSTILVAILTEEGFFRGWFWASLARAGASQAWRLVWTSLAFALWHVSAVMLPTGFDLPAAQIPVYLVNAAVLGAIWGMLRMASGSVIVASVSHGVWNGFAYVWFGYGAEVGGLGIKQTAVYGPEVGIVGLALNVVVLAALWWWWRRGAAEL
jgi:membrane protease YdiL (CAAX protease family)